MAEGVSGDLFPTESVEYQAGNDELRRQAALTTGDKGTEMGDGEALPVEGTHLPQHLRPQVYNRGFQVQRTSSYLPASRPSPFSVNLIVLASLVEFASLVC